MDLLGTNISRFMKFKILSPTEVNKKLIEINDELKISGKQIISIIERASLENVAMEKIRKGVNYFFGYILNTQSNIKDLNYLVEIIDQINISNLLSNDSKLQQYLKSQTKSQHVGGISYDKYRINKINYLKYMTP
jgi:hypothetical protein